MSPAPAMGGRLGRGAAAATRSVPEERRITDFTVETDVLARSLQRKLPLTSIERSSLHTLLCHPPE
ncbi:hypothetical protein ABIF94_001190 [Bradyrhizobium ottawaense]